MKRPLHTSESLITLGPSDDEKGLNGAGFQLMMEGLDDDDCVEDDLCLGKGGQGKKRRLGVEQVRALEKNFEVDNKLEPERKIRLAKELGLQPRQVAIWFQNRRARWKTKQLERDYGSLKASYDALCLEYDALNRDKDALLTQIKELKAKLADDESLSYSSVKKEPVISEEDDEEEEDEDDDEVEEKFILDNSDELPPLIYKNGTSTDSDSSAVLNDANLLNDENSPPNVNTVASHSVNDHQNTDNYGVVGVSIGSVGSAELKTEGFSSIYQNCNNHNPIMKMEENEIEEESCSRIFSDEQAPSLNWYYSDQCWN